MEDFDDGNGSSARLANKASAANQFGAASNEPAEDQYAFYWFVADSKDLGVVSRTTFLTERQIEEQKMRHEADMILAMMYNNSREAKIKKEADEIIQEHKNHTLRTMQLASSRNGYFWDRITSKTIKFREEPSPMMMQQKKGKGKLFNFGKKFGDGE